MIAGWDIWKFRGEDMRLFREGEEIPDGWYDRPSKFNGANPDAFDHDRDGREGGSMKPEDATHVAAWKADLSEVVQVNPVKRKPGRPRKVQP